MESNMDTSAAPTSATSENIKSKSKGPTMTLSPRAERMASNTASALSEISSHAP